MLHPRPMVRLAFLTTKSRERDLVESLYEAGAAQIQPHIDGTLEGLKVGEPLPEASNASALLVRVRALLRHLGIEGTDGVPHVPDAVGQLDAALVDIETNVRNLLERRERAEKELGRLKERLKVLAALEPLGLDLDTYHDYEAVRVFVGRCDQHLATVLGPVTTRFETAGSPGGLQAAWVDAQQGMEAGEALATAGFHEVEVPEGQGPIDQAVTNTRTEVDRLESRLAETKEEMTRLSRRHGALLLTAEAQLSEEVTKAEVPVNFASSEYTVLVDAWVPKDDQHRVIQAVERGTRGTVHHEVLDEGARDDHHREVEPPVDYASPEPVRAFAPLIDMFARPKYNEIDPTILVFITFPLFFGFMIGDLMFGFLMIALGGWLTKRLGQNSEAARGLGLALVIAGIWAALFGGFVFHDAAGIPFQPHGGHGEGGHEGLSWAGLLHMDFHLPEPPIEKLGSDGVPQMIALSVVAAFLHLFVGFVFGFFNEVGHSKRHAIAKLSWMITLIGVTTVVLAQVLPLISEHGRPHMLLADPSFYADNAMMLSWAPLGIGAVGLILTEGPIGGMEILGLLSNVISYARLAGIAVAKGALIGAFNEMFLNGMVLHGSGVGIILAGIVLFFVAQVAIFILGVLSSGIQAIRLNYVEFFLKFFKGGGTTYEPFGRRDTHTSPPTTT